MLLASDELPVSPATDVLYKEDYRLSVERLGVQQLVIAERNGIDSQFVELFLDEWQLGPISFEKLNQTADVVDASLLYSARCHHRLEPLLGSLLSVEADNAVGYLGVGCELADRGGVLLRLAREACGQLG